ncbi:hypothetical protein BpHYR1_038670 [Brachionus plicatilis]|uniref:Uncharacterized protein n=1 Tax=Brachionus plicatilis TaxID=10195 RepID=A0A3M7Q523_BRAPC|nr:hypothetical protein BpHYR1_038670 [Brachionus plicatilis]
MIKKVFLYLLLIASMENLELIYSNYFLFSSPEDQLNFTLDFDKIPLFNRKVHILKVLLHFIFEIAVEY